MDRGVPPGCGNAVVNTLPKLLLKGGGESLKGKLLDPEELIVALSTCFAVLEVFAKGGEVPGWKFTIQKLVNPLTE
jgi:hypothetical protein